MTLEDFSKLGAHLEQLNPLIEGFCEKHGFERITGPSVGRYPRIRLQRREDITFWLDLVMGLNRAGERFSHFSPELPYELGGGASFDEKPECPGRWRKYQKCFLIWPATPFREVAAKLPEGLEYGVTVLNKWDLAFLKKEGRLVQMGE